MKSTIRGTKRIGECVCHAALRCMLAAVCLGCHVAAWAQEAERTGTEWGAELTSELQATHTGKYNYANLLRLRAAISMGKGFALHLASLSACMTSEESIGGDMQTFSNLDAGNMAFALSRCGVEWQMGGGHALFAGVQNMNEDYFASPATSFFTNSSCGIYPTISANYPIANYPVASVGVHYRFEAAMGGGTNRLEADADRLVLQASVYNGTGYNRLTGRDNVFRVCPGSDGVFVLTEAQYHSRGSSYFVGNALHSNTHTCASPWLYAEQRVADGLKVVAGYSHAFGRGLACRDFAGLGLHYGHGRYELGIFSDYACFKVPGQAATSDADNATSCKEFATELGCKVQLASHLYVQPVVHLITTQGSFGAIGMLRLGVSL